MPRALLALCLCCLTVSAAPDTIDNDIDFVLARTAPPAGHAATDFFAAATADGTRELGVGHRDWLASITPYVWFTGFGVETGGEQFSSEFSDVAQLTNSGFMVIGAFEWKRWAFGVDYTYADLGGGSALGRATASFGFLQHILHLGVGYAVIDHGSPKNPTGVRLRLQVGARYWDTSARFNISIPPILPGGETTTIEVDGGQSWWDLTTGFGARWVLNPKVGFRLWGNVGGFGIGNSSDYTWEAGFVTSFLVSKWFGFHVGYRMLQYKRESGGTDTKLTMQGPMIGFTFVF